ncbi:ribonuclease Z [Sulfurovum mangrovi]|uniref:ribonuclease Z n=1 Tax=Sulfurovum mangrovi TaxID=2893889 RepID=UPI001E3A1A2D|nr:ribonuclease Z [Sulfurovum mangrovi]UFH58115.1 ribonuclease Z [Sulfurovum mangrovi]
MQFTFLGTSAGKPTRERNVSALGLEFDQDTQWYLFDCGEGTQHQLLRSRLSVGKLSTIFITHMHGDHYYGLPGLLSSKKLDKAFNPLTIYGPIGIRQFIACVMKDISYEKLGYELTIIEYTPYDEYTFDKFTLKVLPLIHSVESHAFSIKENDTSNRLDEEKLRAKGVEPSPLFGELKRGKKIVVNGETISPESFMLEPHIGRKVIIAGDNAVPEIMGDYLEEIDLLVHECTYLQETYDHLPVKVQHTTAKDLGRCAQDHCVKNLIATHINPRYNANGRIGIEAVEKELARYYKGNLFIANDFDTYLLNRDGIIIPL